MSVPSIDPGDLLDLKLMPAWVKEPSARENYANFEGEEATDRGDRPPRHPRGRGKPPSRDRSAPGRFGKREGQDRRGRDGRHQPREIRREERPPKPETPLEVEIQFLPRTPVLDNVVTQVKSEALAYSLFFLSRSFLEKPQRYEVALKAKPESPLYRLGEAGVVSSDRDFLESNAFRLAREDFYRVEVTQSEPLKGSFTSVARCRLSGTVLGPTNHHDYQRKLRGFYEQRFSRRMNFGEYQRQIETVNDPAVVDQWKEEARNVTTFVTLDGEPPVTFQTAADAERHFRQHHLPNLIQTVEEVVIDGVDSRQLADRRLRRHIEEAWTVENRSPSHMMQELAKKFRDTGLHIFRHKRGMLFVSSIRVRPFVHEEQGVSGHVQAILQVVAGSPRIRRKEVADKLLAEAGEDLEARKLSLASNLRWLISEGYVIEFNDGALDLPRAKTKKPEDNKDNGQANDTPVAAVEPEVAMNAETASDPTAESEIEAAQPPHAENPDDAAIDPNRHSGSGNDASEIVSPQDQGAAVSSPPAKPNGGPEGAVQ